MYSFFKTLTICYFPPSLCLGIIFLSLVFLWFSGKQKLGKFIVTIGFSFLVLFSIPIIPDYFLGLLERQNKAFVILMKIIRTNSQI